MKIHIVKKGNTLYELSKKYAISLKDLITMNPQIENPDQLEVGMKVIVPSTTEPNVPSKQDIAHTHIVVQGDSLWALSKKFNVSLQDLIQANKHLKNPNALLTGEKVFIPRHDMNQGTVDPAPVFHNPGQISTESLEDAFAQDNVSAVQASSFYDMPTIPETQFPQNMNAYNPSVNSMSTANMMPNYGAMEQPNMMPPYGAMEPSNMMPSNAALYSGNKIPPYNCMNPCLIPLMYAHPYAALTPYSYSLSQYNKRDCGCGGRAQAVPRSIDEARNEEEIRKPDMDE
ncbi:MAG TPA: LysM peptidoglycan-binding domain-containing protein, partial [Bacilli bacterium]